MIMQVMAKAFTQWVRRTGSGRLVPPVRVRVSRLLGGLGTAISASKDVDRNPFARRVSRVTISVRLQPSTDCGLGVGCQGRVRAVVRQITDERDPGTGPCKHAEEQGALGQSCGDRVAGPGPGHAGIIKSNSPRMPRLRSAPDSPCVRSPARPCPHRLSSARAPAPGGFPPLS
jgi:hypothetical protein